MISQYNHRPRSDNPSLPLFEAAERARARALPLAARRLARRYVVPPRRSRGVRRSAQRASSTPRPSIKRGRRIAFNVTEGEDVRTIKPAGRDAWALGELIASGTDGCTPITHVGPRWSGYVHKLRHVYSLSVETIAKLNALRQAATHELVEKPESVLVCGSLVSSRLR